MGIMTIPFVSISDDAITAVQLHLKGALAVDQPVRAIKKVIIPAALPVLLEVCCCHIACYR